MARSHRCRRYPPSGRSQKLNLEPSLSPAKIKHDRDCFASKCETTLRAQYRAETFMNYLEIIDRRRRLAIPPYKSLADMGLDGPWVTPYQIMSNSLTGPVLVALHWLDEAAIRDNEAGLRKIGYLPEIRFNAVLDIALRDVGLNRSEIYVTQTFHLIPASRSQSISPRAIRQSFDEITQHELRGRKVVALGAIAARECARCDIPHQRSCHPSRRGYSNEQNATEIAKALRAVI